ncbi:hypothetical protein [Rubellicoccus peritrichatus]|uniref:Uncharacterized protein n=1 Tax=Rubellicoccus peritrichatus TaxID=3080537 RepID=A0AAQ3L7A6_9BACT|nr:hypothetical protein [Puniceicoccus sp. CR14]WOO40371.1 hypothetical protein RZN69_17265 [Puniceicoccus sp. CR14]WOO40420.1 hypothetical protein RZN69_17510 [Puniceicoccus sp. CR14]WOO40469.1 hypothetical protein RZN69_17755 [Puniceicoccus sp. CR14]WOO40518.1 hypothetical protein RZN69_18000 [Puniceicoccus sp. CR14]
MALSDLTLIIDKSSRRLVESFFSRSYLTELGDFYQEDEYNLRVLVVEPAASDSQDYFWDYVDLGAGTLKAKLGLLNEPPTSGNFRITDPENVQETGDIDFNADASTIQSEIRSSLSLGYSNAEVSGDYLTGWVIDRGEAGEIEEPTVNAGSIQPTSNPLVSVKQDGSESVNAIFRIRMIQAAAAYQDVFSDLSNTGFDAVRLVSGTSEVNEKQRIILDPQPYAGSFTITLDHGGSAHTTGLIEWDADAATIQLALEGLENVGSGNITVSKTSSSVSQWDILFTGTLSKIAIDNLLSIDVTGLSVPVGKVAAFNLNTDGVEDLVTNHAVSGKAEAEFEIEWTPLGGKPFTLLRGSATVIDDLISSLDTVPTPKASYSTTEQANALYQPIEDQRLSTSDDATFNSISAEGSGLTGVDAATLEGASLASLATVANLTAELERQRNAIYTNFGLLEFSSTEVIGSATASIEPQNSKAALRTFTTANSRARLRINNNSVLIAPGSTAGIRWSVNELEVALSINAITPNAEGIFRMFVGKTTVLPFGLQVGDWVGVELRDRDLWGIACDAEGSVVSVDLSTTIALFPLDQIKIKALNGNVEWFVNDVSVGSTASGPNSNNASVSISYEVENGATAADYRLSVYACSHGFPG